MDRRLRARAVAAAAAGLGALAAATLAPPAAVREARAEGEPLAIEEVRDLVARAVHFSDRLPGDPALTVAVVDTEGNALAVFHEAEVPAAGALDLAELTDPNARPRRTARALAKAGTAAYFSSDEESFTTRTAAFIIEDHFPPGVRHAPGGPLYGVEFSNLGTSDVNPIALPVPAAAFEARVRGDLGGVGLFKGGRRVGGLGIDDGREDRQLSIPDDVLFGGECERGYRLTFGNLERGRPLERIAMAAARPYLPPARIRAGRITIDGFRLPFSATPPLRESQAPSLVPGVDGDYDPAYPLRAATGIASRFVDVTLPPPPGAGPGAASYSGQMPAAFPVRAGTDGLLTAADVTRMLWQGARRASITRAAIRRPIGLAMQCWISVVDTNGEVLGVFRFRDDATLFSYDVSVQKARTAMFFSDEFAAWSTRGVGLFAQQFYPAGQQDAFTGPVFQVQDGITVGLVTGAISPVGFPLRNGITVFAGGVPVYKGASLAGGVGVSGDGIDQDDLVATFAAEGFGARADIRCDALGPDELRRSLARTMSRLAAFVGPNPGTCAAASLADVDEVGLTFFHRRLELARKRIANVPFEVGPSYVKFPRHPGPVTR